MGTHPPPEGWDSDGSLSWEDFFGPATCEDLVPTLVGMYDALVGRGGVHDANKPPPTPPPRGQWSAKVERRWNCRCTGKAASLAVTRCAACVAEVRSTDIRDSMVLDSASPPPQRRAPTVENTPNLLNVAAGDQCSLLACPARSPEPVRAKTSTPLPSSPPSSPPLSRTPSAKCHLLTCPVSSGGRSAPGTPSLPRPAVSPLALKRLRAEGGVSRPLSVSSIASSSSSSCSGGSCCSHRLGVPLKSAYLASIESLEDPSETERRKSGVSRTEWFKCDDSQGSADSGVHSSCSVSQGRPRYGGSHVSYMDRVVMEIIETEQIYVRDLQTITEGYLRYWQSQPDFPLMDRLPELFGNLEDIYHFNSMFLKDLEQCGLDPVKVARCFVRNNVGFSVYTDYCTNYPRTVSSLTELMRQEGTVRLFRERQTALQQTLPLGSYLLKPVQRILKYHLLLQNIVKQSVKDVVGYADIEDALAAMTGIAQHINDMKRRHEHAVRVQEIQSLLYGWEGEDLTTFGELCAEGAFRMSGAKALRHIFLFDKILLITKKKEEGVLGYKAHIDCSNLMLIESVPGEPLSFHVIPFDNPRLQYTLQARTAEQKREWTLQIKRVILENYNAVIPSHARQLVMELGQNRSQDEVKGDRSAPKRQHSAPEYLERRKQDRRKSEAGFRARLRRTRKSDAGSTPTGQQRTCGSAGGKAHDQRRQSEPLPRCDSSSTIAVTSDETPSHSPDEVSIDLTNAEEVQTIEQIVGQLLMQNREFEKILKRQKHHVNMRNRNLDSISDIRSETTDDEEDGIYETLINVKLVLASEACDEPDSDYVTLLCDRDEETVKKHPSVRRMASLQPENGESPLQFLENVTSLEKMTIPTLPSVWLQQQGPHLATPSKKAGSLPRSFQMNVEGGEGDEAFKDARNSVERPFTIASDQPNAMLYDERYCRPFPLRHDGVDNESLTESGSTPGASLDHIDVHPDYRIYRSGVSTRALRQAISSVGSRLAHLKVDLTTRGADDGKVLQWERKASRLVNMLARQCSKTIKSHLKNGNSSLDVSPVSQAQPTSLPVFMQGSSNLGARIANGNTKLEKVRPKAAAFLGIEADSLISLSSSMCSVSEADDQTQDSEQAAGSLDDSSPQEPNDAESDISIDSFYERSFEAMDEELLKNGSALSDTEEGHFSDEERRRDEPDVRASCVKSPPPVPGKPRPKPPPDEPQAKVVVRGVEEEVFKRSKSIRERQRELEQWRLRKEEEGDTSSQHSTASTVIEVETCPSDARPKGWVRHVVGKLQAADSKTETSSMFKT